MKALADSLSRVFRDKKADIVPVSQAFWVRMDGVEFSVLRDEITGSGMDDLCRLDDVVAMRFRIAAEEV